MDGPSRSTDADWSCPRCGYSLAGLREERCPECGAAFDRERPPIRGAGVDRRRAVVAAIGGAVVVFALIWMANSAREPVAWSPYAIPLLLPRTWGVPAPFVAAGAAACFLVSGVSLLRGNRKPPVAWAPVVVLSAALSGFWCVRSYPLAAKHQSPEYAAATIAISAVSVVIVLIAWFVGRRRASFAAHWIVHVVSWVWMLGWALPYMGELP